MAKRFIPTALTMGIVSALSLSTLSQAHAESILDYIIDTTPAGLVETTNGSHQWSDLLDGSKKIMEEGKTMWIVPTYTNHPRWAWDNRRQQNAHPFGMGLGRTVIDGRGNERSLFFVTFVDSNYRIEPTMGYQWSSQLSTQHPSESPCYQSGSEPTIDSQSGDRYGFALHDLHSVYRRDVYVFHDYD